MSVDDLAEKVRGCLNDRDGMTFGRARRALADLVALARRAEQAEAFVAEMSGLITDFGDVPDPGRDELAGMARAIRARFEQAEAREAALREALDWIEAEPEDPLKVQARASAALAAPEGD